MGIAGQGGAAVAWKLDLRNHLNEALLGVCNHLPHLHRESSVYMMQQHTGLLAAVSEAVSPLRPAGHCMLERFHMHAAPLPSSIPCQAKGGCSASHSQGSRQPPVTDCEHLLLAVEASAALCACTPSSGALLCQLGEVFDVYKPSKTS